MGARIKIYISYDRKDPKDRSLRHELERHLRPLVQNGLITIWSPDQILPGRDLEQEIDAHLTESHIILLLLSASFMASSACQKEVERAMERHKAKEASVIPVLLRPVDWESTFGKIAPLPMNKKSIALWENQDEALLDVETGIRRVIEVTQEIQQTSEGTAKAKLYETLVRLNYKDQATIFRQFWQENHQAGVFLIHGAPSYGQGWLLNRLIRQLPRRSTFKVFRFNFQRKARGRSIQELWNELASFVGMTNITYPLNVSTQQEIVRKLYNRWLTGPIILILNNLHEIEEQYISTFLQDFWQPLLGMTNDAQNQSPHNYLLMFLIDNADCVDKWSIQLAPGVDSTWKPYIPLKLKKLTVFSEDVLDHWISHEFETLPPDITAKKILDNSFDGTPEDALDYICIYYECQWLDLVTYRLTS